MEDKDKMNNEDKVVRDIAILLHDISTTGLLNIVGNALRIIYNRIGHTKSILDLTGDTFDIQITMNAHPSETSILQ